jgi:UDP-N-acetylmuramate dehydrogenase
MSVSEVVVDRVVEDLDARGVEVRRDERLSRHTTIGIGGPAQIFVRPRSADEMVVALGLARSNGLPIKVLGAGSNLLVSDEGVHGMVIQTTALNRVSFPGDGIVEAEAGAHFPTLVRQTAAQGLRGLEAGVGIPGSLGGVLTMNAGAYQFAIGPMVVLARAVSPELGKVELQGDQIDFRYRSSSFGPNLIVVWARLSLATDAPEAIKRDMDQHMRFRKQTQPVGVKSAGCIFKNPEGDSAGRLIDSLGLKGFGVGGARVSEVHANFIVHDGDASARDVSALIEAIRERARREASVELEPEVMRWST